MSILRLFNRLLRGLNFASRPQDGVPYKHVIWLRNVINQLKKSLLKSQITNSEPVVYIHYIAKSIGSPPPNDINIFHEY